jgi:hypothetical protein
MVASTAYLETAKTEQLEKELTSQGYAIEREKRMDGSVYDLVASRGNERIAIEVKAQNRLRDGARELSRLRERAFQLGFTEFRLVVVNPPRSPRIEIEGLARALRAFLLENPPRGLDELSSNTVIEGVSGPEIDEIEVKRDGTRVVGDASLQLRLEDGGGKDGSSMDVSLPLRFDVLLGPGGDISQAAVIEVDTSSFRGD